MDMTKKVVLQDHKRKRKTFIPPFTQMLGPLREISWVKTMLPELLWIALIQDYYGHAKGVALITSLTRLARKCSVSEKKRIFATLSSFGEMTIDEQSCLHSEIATSGAKILFVGLGCPKQERWIAAQRRRLSCVMVGVGAAFDFHAGAKRQAPRWIQRAGLEWLFRLCSEPRRLGHRYLYHNPRFLLHFARQLATELATADARR